MRPHVVVRCAAALRAAAPAPPYLFRGMSHSSKRSADGSGKKDWNLPRSKGGQDASAESTPHTPDKDSDTPAVIGFDVGFRDGYKVGFDEGRRRAERELSSQKN
ncbi:hypothetical protein COEREDRAFT_84911 [Coemansia reversa NRRL 1564]|uniref:Uncharacterized protein n=1 Tax=Coemansia reversa (strain ATCC 12441 / NRRL 1564) TaxID=763665 RepID=A0A2G5BIW4_COERN|nr:hypothetical protein COEREDRAFT_84911 [Coemansia reversa NRRL 1564]|eukprot:PIA18974.1 hypothetical protein COEREDRAFT_84911 [Coemansia reversa NRRL 1564]